LKALAAAGTALAGALVTDQAVTALPAQNDTAAPADSTASAPTDAEHQWAFVVDLRRCDGCGHCTTACQKMHYLAEDQTWIKVYSITDADGLTHPMVRLCMHCENAPCVRVCPVGATYKNDEGVVLVNQNVCIGCRTCMAACPYEARYFNWEQPPDAPSTLEQPMPEYPVPAQKGTVGKCILCVHNTEVGKLPACVEGCPMQALYIGDLKKDVATNGQETVKLSTFLRENDAVRYREELGTRPRVWYIPGHGQLLNF
jgi:molybdopterin-containing oxidoreductase family iron-sulfur binding subunit